MKIIDKIALKQDIYNYPSATIAILGDSVSQGCFECYEKTPGCIETIFERKNAYSTKLKEFLNVLYPSSQINIINSGLSGDNAPNGLSRMDRDIFPYSPDLCIVSYQLNDSCNGSDQVQKYIDSLREIFHKLKERNIEIIFLNENYMCTGTSPFLQTELEKRLSKSFAEIQNSGLVVIYMEAAKKLCEEENVKVCDVYSLWDKMYNHGVNVTELLANKLNHPIREFHSIIAYELIKIMFED